MYFFEPSWCAWSMDWKTARKPADFRENRRNRSGSVSPVFQKLAGQIWNFQKIEIKILKKLEPISRFLVKTKFVKIETVGKIGKKENPLVPYKGQP
jgi:hypothetical protein